MLATRIDAQRGKRYRQRLILHAERWQLTVVYLKRRLVLLRRARQRQPLVMFILLAGVVIQRESLQMRLR